MELLGITHTGMEDITAIELEEYGFSDVKLLDSCVKATFTDRVTLCRAAYRCQSMRRVLELLVSGDGPTIETMREAVGSMDGEHLKGKRFAVRASIDGEHTFSRQDVERDVGGIIKDTFGCEVDLDNPDVPVFVFVTAKAYHIGIDYGGFDLSRRPFHLFTNPAGLRGSVAYGLVRLSGFDGSGVFVDPFCKAGDIAIEAALLMHGKSPHHFQKERFAFQRFLEDDWEARFSGWDAGIECKGLVYGYDDQFRHVKSAKSNAKVAGVKEGVVFSKVTPDWLDTKHGEGEVGHMATMPPQVSRHHSKKEVSSLYAELFYALDYVMARDGDIVVVCSDPDVFSQGAARYGFHHVEERVIFQGHASLSVQRIQKT